MAQIRHFLGGNFFNQDGRLVNNTPAVSEFRQPTPPAGSDVMTRTGKPLCIIQELEAVDNGTALGQLYLPAVAPIIRIHTTDTHQFDDPRITL